MGDPDEQGVQDVREDEVQLQDHQLGLAVADPEPAVVVAAPAAIGPGFCLFPKTGSVAQRRLSTVNSGKLHRRQPWTSEAEADKLRNGSWVEGADGKARNYHLRAGCQPVTVAWRGLCLRTEAEDAECSSDSHR